MRSTDLLATSPYTSRDSQHLLYRSSRCVDPMLAKLYQHPSHCHLLSYPSSFIAFLSPHSSPIAAWSKLSSRHSTPRAVNDRVKADTLGPGMPLHIRSVPYPTLCCPAPCIVPCRPDHVSYAHMLSLLTRNASEARDLKEQDIL